MAFLLSDGIRTSEIYLDTKEYSGVKTAAGWLADDIGLISGKEAEVKCIDAGASDIKDIKGIIAGTVGISGLIDQTLAIYGIDPGAIKGKRFGVDRQSEACKA